MDKIDKPYMTLSRNDVLNLLKQEKLRFELALIISRGRVPKAAEIAGISERHFYRKILQYDLNPMKVKEDLFNEP